MSLKILFKLGDLTFSNQSFGAIEHIEESNETFLADGVLGLGWSFDPANRHKDEMPILNFLDQLDKPLYTVWLQR